MTLLTEIAQRINVRLRFASEATRFDDIAATGNVISGNTAMGNLLK